MLFNQTMDGLTAFLSATSVTEQVLITQISAFSPLRAVRIPASFSVLPMVEVSEKFNLQPKCIINSRFNPGKIVVINHTFLSN